MAAGDQASYSPVQLQKLFFLMDREARTQTGGPYFDFKPYDYGPFDADVYNEVEQLAKVGYAVVDSGGFYRVYSLTAAGIEEGKAALGEIAQPGREYAARAANWVRSVSFNQLVSEIYKRYPDMKENSVFREP
ncbi:MAG TPA: hypothetical protein VND20_10605 [Candidatus Binataceae bacterium]|nr:hypothetical protein [Candidatus Binataceae bacterium]